MYEYTMWNSAYVHAVNTSADIELEYNVDILFVITWDRQRKFYLGKRVIRIERGDCNVEV